MRPRTHLSRHWPRWAVLGGLMLLVALPTGCRPPPDVQRGVLLLSATGEPDSAEDFDLRFEDPVVSLDQVGIEAKQPPLHFDPPLSGTFVWTSRRSGLFTLAETPLPATRYVITLRPGLRDADGRLVAAGLRRTIETPGLEAQVQFSPYGLPWEEHWNSSDAMSPVYLLFNHPVMTDNLSSRLAFMSDEGQRVEARLRVPDYRVQPASAFGHPFATRFRPTPSPAPNSPTGPQGMPPQADQFVVSPASPLPPAAQWKLTVAAGVRAGMATPLLDLANEIEFTLGPIQPFDIRDITGFNELNRDPRIQIQFSRPLQMDLDAEELAGLVTVTPEPPGLERTVGGDSLVLSAPDHGLVAGTNYQVHIDGRVSAGDGTRLGKDQDHSVRLDPLESRLYLPVYSAEQMASSRRELRVVSVNTPRFRIRAKRLERPQLIHALRGYGSYFKAHRLENHQVSPHREVDFNVVPGVTTLDRWIDVPVTTDAQHVTALSWDEMLGSGKRGAVFVDAGVPGLRDDQQAFGTQGVLQLTDLGLHWKRWDTNVLVQVFSYSSGKPLKGVPVAVVNEEDLPRSEGISDDAGLVRLTTQSEADWIVATLENDVHAVAIQAYDTSLYRTGVPTSFYDSGERQPVLLFSDRNLYRPGDTLHLKAISRTWKNERLEVPANIPATLSLIDPQWDTVLRTNLSLGELGSLDWDFTLPAGPTGGYSFHLETSTGGMAWWQFTIAEYQPDAFEVTIDAPAELAAGESLCAPVSARYLFGSPVSRGEVRWTVDQRDAGFAPAGFDEWTFISSWLPMELAAGEDASGFTQGEGTYTAATNLVLAPELSFHPKAPQPREVDLAVELTDLNQQTIRAQTSTVAHSSDCYLGVKQGAEVLAAGEPAAFALCVIGRDGEPWPQALSATARVSQVVWNTVRYEGAGGRPTYRSECALTNTLEQPIEIAPMQSIEGVRQAASEFTFTPAEAGQYLLEIEAVDPSNRRILTRTGFHVAAGAELAWDYRNAARLELVPDRLEYQAGDTATVLIKAPFSGEALVSVERGSVRRAFQTRLEGNAPVIRIPLDPEDAPNVFAVVTLLRGADESPHEVKMPDFRYGACELKVAPTRHRLTLDLATDSPEYRPGATVQATLAARDNTGASVADAELTLFAVDDGVLNLGAYEVPDPEAAFLDTQALGVRTSLSLFKLMSDDPDLWTYPNKGYLIGGGGGEAEALRQNFIPCPLWIGSLRTDAHGAAGTEFVAPDSLTRYRLIAIAHTADSRFGRATTTFETRKPLMLTPALPQFARVGDHLLARALLHNDSGTDRQVKVTLALGGDVAFAGSAGTTQVETTVATTSGATAVVEFPVTFTKPGPAEWSWVATTVEDPTGCPGERDAVRSLLNVEHRAPLLRQVLETVVSGGSTNLLAEADPNLLGGEATITVRASDSRALSLREAFENLLHYPYGCVEQTCSSLLPWLLVKREPALAKVLNLETAKVDAAIAAGIDRLFSMQTAQGGVSYWPGEYTPQHWGSAYAAVVLAVARSAGVSVPVDPFNNLVQYLHQQAGNLTGAAGVTGLPDFTAHCLAAFAFAMSDLPMPALSDRLFAHRGELTTEEQMLLAASIALGSAKDGRIAVLLGAPEDETSRDYYGGRERRAAVHLLAATFGDAASAETHRLARDLLKLRHHSHWVTTQGNAWAAFALLEYLDRQSPESGPAAGKLKLGTDDTSFDLTDAEPLFHHEYRAVATERERLDFTNTGSRTLFVETEIAARVAVSSQPLNQGFEIARTYQRIDAQGTIQPADDLKVGDPVLVTLELRLDRPAHFIAIDDPLPAVLEVANLPTRQTAAEPDTPTSADQVRTLWSDFREIRADRVLFFVDHLAAGSWQVRYLARARAAGEVIAPPAKIEAMYDPERRGLTATTTLNCTSTR